MHHRIAVISELQTTVQYNFRNPGRRHPMVVIHFRQPECNTISETPEALRQSLVAIHFRQPEMHPCQCFGCQRIIRFGHQPRQHCWHHGRAIRMPPVYLLWYVHLPNLGVMGMLDLGIKTEEECRESCSLLYSLSPPSYTRLGRVHA